MTKACIVTILVAFLLNGCILEEKKEAVISSTSDTISWKRKKSSITNSIVNMAIQAHGGGFYDSAAYTFTFRSKTYTFIHNRPNWEYKVVVNSDTLVYEDVLKNGVFRRSDSLGKQLILNAEDSLKYAESLNSVLYFATLPYKLQDKAVRKKFVGTDSIKGKNYYTIQVTFNKEGGGKDFDDEFLYWINTKNYTIDYLAYRYHTNGGGIRFREAYNRRLVDGVIFQDYINYKAKQFTPLTKLPQLYALDSLKEVSRIETENVKKINLL